MEGALSKFNCSLFLKLLKTFKSFISFLYKMEIVNRVSAFQNYQNFSRVIAEETKPASDDSQSTKSE